MANEPEIKHIAGNNMTEEHITAQNGGRPPEGI
jgi:hypothetical protein